MGWIFQVVMMLFYGAEGYERAKREGTWQWSQFWIALGFGATVCLLVTAPIFLIKMDSPYFVPVYIGTWVLALAAIVWFAIYSKRRMKRPNVRAGK